MKTCLFNFFLGFPLFINCPNLLSAQATEGKPNYNKTYLPEGRDPGDTVYVFVEEMPIIIGGKPALQNFLDNAPYPDCVSSDSIANVVVFKFIVETDGTISDLRVARNPDSCFTNAATLYMKQMPPWQPGKRNGKPVPCLFTLPVTYRN